MNRQQRRARYRAEARKRAAPFRFAFERRRTSEWPGLAQGEKERAYRMRGLAWLSSGCPCANAATIATLAGPA